MEVLRTVTNAVNEAVKALVSMLRDAFTAFVQNWPVLFTLFFAGTALRGLFLWLAIEASSFSPLLGMLLLPLAPISLLIALVLMLRRVAPTLPELQETLVGSRQAQVRADLTIAVMVLVPFLAVYASQGMIKEDRRSFLYSATTDEWLNQGFNADFSRVVFGSDAQMIAIVIIALVLRKVIAGFNLGKSSLPVAGFAGYLEALWLVTLASYFAWSIDSVRGWVQSRVVIRQVGATFDGIMATLGPVGSIIQAVIDQVTGIVSSMGSLVIIPVAWIAVGATIYGSSLPSARPMMTSEQMTQRLQRVPNPVRRVAAQVSEPVVNPFRNTVRAIGRVATAGVIPMVMLCVIFAFTSQLRVWVTQVLRLLIGPQSGAFWVGVSPFIDVLAQSVYMTVMVCLLASSVNTIIASQRRLVGEESAATQQEPAQSSAESEPAKPALP